MARNKANTIAIITTDALPPASLTNTYSFPLLSGAKQLAVLSALHGIVTRWRVRLQMAVGGTFNQIVSPFSSGNWSYNIDYSFDVDATLRSDGSAPASEAQLANPREALQPSGIVFTQVIGTYAETIDGIPASGNVIAANLRFSALIPGYATFAYDLATLTPPWISGSHGATSAFFGGSALSGGLAVGNLLTIESAQETSGFEAAIGDCTIEIPDWLEDFYPSQFTGLPKLVTNLCVNRGGISPNYHTTFLGTGSVSIIPNVCLPYGYDPAAPLSLTTTERIWNDDGSANSNPLIVPVP